MNINASKLLEYWGQSQFTHSGEHGTRTFIIQDVKIEITYEVRWYTNKFLTNYEIYVGLRAHVDTQTCTFTNDATINDLIVTDIMTIKGTAKELQTLLEKKITVYNNITLRGTIFGRQDTNWNKLQQIFDWLTPTYSCKEVSNVFKAIEPHGWDILNVQTLVNVRNKKFIYGVLSDWCSLTCKGTVYYTEDILVFEKKEDAMLFKLAWL